MKIDQELFQTIKRYHTAALNQEEIHAFEERLNRDQEFAEEVKIHQMMYETIQRYGDQLLDADLMKRGKALLASESSEQHSRRQSAKVRSIRPWYLAAIAAAVVLLLIVMIPQMVRQPATPGDLYKTHFEALTPGLVRGFAAQEVYKEAVNAYESQNYDQAIEKFQMLISDTTFIRKSEAWLFVGISYLAKDKPEEALDALVQVSDTSGHIDMANWYVALTHLRLDQPDQARIVLKDIAGDSKHEKRARARKILNELEEYGNP